MNVINKSTKQFKHKAELFAWKHNALRHSFISFRVAMVLNADQVALEASNSRKVIFESYRELVTAEQANGWFSIVPQKMENAVPLNESVTSGKRVFAKTP